jgi:hypothetical protein
MQASEAPDPESLQSKTPFARKIESPIKAFTGSSWATWNGAGGCVIASHGAVQRSRIGDDRYLERGDSAGAHAIRRQKRPPLKALSGSSFHLRTPPAF